MEYNKKYVYDYGFGNKVYFCPSCGSYHLTPKHLGGMQPHDWVCEECTIQCSFTSAKSEKIKVSVNLEEYIKYGEPTPEVNEFAAQHELALDFGAYFGGTWELQMN